jgi:hypothetical protein
LNEKINNSESNLNSEIEYYEEFKDINSMTNTQNEWSYPINNYTFNTIPGIEIKNSRKIK